MRVKSRKSTSCGINKADALALLEKEGCSDHLKRHVTAVSKYARTLAEKIKFNGYSIDPDFVEVAALLHDIGRCRTNGVSHGIEGCRMLESISPAIARVCEVHIGAGLDKNEAAALGLPPKDYMPTTLEEKVVAHADNLVQGDKVVTIKEAVEEFEGKLGKGHSAVKRIKDLNDYVEGLCKNAKT